jgi:Arc/MetJ-type ribon-helix-helix transcriptional regulator
MADYRARVDEDLSERIDEVLESDEGYKTKNGFVNEAIRRLLDQVELRRDREEIKEQVKEEALRELRDSDLS